MNLINDIVDTHLAAYCEADPVIRTELLHAAWTETGAIIDPPLGGTGLDGISAAADSVLQHFPGHRFVRTSEIDAHHTFARYSWALTDRDGAIAVTGTDFVETDDNGQLVRIVGFFGELVGSTHRAEPTPSVT
jgi:hypothetical protein